jgi:hypothetical protein
MSSEQLLLRSFLGWIAEAVGIAIVSWIWPPYLLASIVGLTLFGRLVSEWISVVIVTLCIAAFITAAEYRGILGFVPIQLNDPHTPPPGPVFLVHAMQVFSIWGIGRAFELARGAAK